MNLTKNDYIKILKYYNINDYKSYTNKEIKKKAENILASKLCRCIKTIKYKENSIAICANSVIKKKNLKYNKFSCKKKSEFKNRLTKTKRNLKL